MDSGAIDARILDVSVPFHSNYLFNAAEDLKIYLETIKIHRPEIPVIANWNCKIMETETDIKEALYKQVCLPVLWTQTMEKLIAMSIDVFIHIGPGRSTLTLLKKVKRKIKEYSVYHETDMAFLTNAG